MTAARSRFATEMPALARPAAFGSPSIVGAAMLGLLAIAGCGAWLQFHTFINHDVAWTLWGAGRMLHGAEFGRDIIEPNPPLAWYLSMPAAWLAEHARVAVDDAFRIFVGLLALGSCAVSFTLLRRTAASSEREAWLFSLAAGAFMLVFVGRNFGQREHLALILALPYVVAAAVRLEGSRLPRWAAIVIGAAAALGLAQKPYFLAVPALVETVILMRTRRISSVLRAETVALAFVTLGYAAMIVTASPHYLSEVVPKAMRIYWGFNLPLGEVISRAMPVLAALAMIGILLPILRAPAFPTVLAAAALGFFLQYAAQMKGFSYHLFPFTAAVALTLISASCRLKRSGETVVAAGALTACAFLMAIGTVQTATWWRDNEIGRGGQARETQSIIDVVRREADRGYFLSISTHPYPAFPVALHVEARSALKTSNQLFLPAVVRLRAGERDGDPETLALAERETRALMLDNLALEPRVVIVDEKRSRLGIGDSRFDILGFLAEDAGFRKAWEAYRESNPIGPYRIFLKR